MKPRVSPRHPRRVRLAPSRRKCGKNGNTALLLIASKREKRHNRQDRQYQPPTPAIPAKTATFAIAETRKAAKTARMAMPLARSRHILIGRVSAVDSAMHRRSPQITIKPGSRKAARMAMPFAPIGGLQHPPLCPDTFSAASLSLAKR